MTREYLTCPASRLRHSPKHIRFSLGDEAELQALGGSYLNRPLNPIVTRLVEGFYEILDGNRRLTAAILVGGPDVELPICVTDEPFSAAVALEIQMESASYTRGLSDWEKYNGATEWLKLNSNGSAKDLSRIMNCSESVVSLIVSLSKGIPAVKEAAKAGKLSYSKWAPICRLDPEDQPALLAVSLGDASRDELANESKKRRAKATPASTVKAASIKVTVDGVTVMAKGDGMTLDRAIELLPDALRRLEKYRKEAMDIRMVNALERKKAKGRPTASTNGGA